MKQIKIGYCDFGDNFNPETHLFTKLLQTKYEVIISDTPDYLFYATAGQEHHSFDGIRIYYTGENVIPNFNCCDYAFGFAPLSFQDRYMRLPLWAFNLAGVKRAQKRSFSSDLTSRPFCATVISNSKQTDGIRNQFFNMLNEYKPLASGGQWQNNVGGPVADKIIFQSKYKFTMAFENTYAPGYTTEKILDAFISDTIPIYYGDPLVIQDFNPRAFINAHDFSSLEDLKNYVIHVDQDDNLYQSIFEQPVFQPNVLDKYSTRAILNFLSHIIEQPYNQARRRFYMKPYQDIDVINIKTRDIKAIINSFTKTKVFKIK